MKKEIKKKSKFKTCKKCRTETMLAYCHYCGTKVQEVKNKKGGGENAVS